MHRGDNSIKNKIVDTLAKAKGPLDVKQIKEAVGISHWHVCIRHCLELLIEGRIHGWKTAKSWIFIHPEHVNSLKAPASRGEAARA